MNHFVFKDIYHICTRNNFITMNFHFIYIPIFHNYSFNLQTSLILNLVISIVNAIFVCFSSNYCDKLGRKRLLLLGIIPIILGMIILTIAFSIGIRSNVAVYLVSVFLTTIGYCFGFGTCCWVLSAEMFPVRVSRI
jgi:MFS family permease